MIRVTPGNETMIVAKTDGIIRYTRNNLVKGKRVTKGTQLFSISGSDLIGNNLDVRFLTAKNELQRSREAFQRAKSLIKEKIISRQEFLTRKSQFVSDSLEYRILKNNYYSETLSINAPITGELYDLFVKNGDYVSAGQKLAIISGNHHLYLAVDLPKQYYAKIHHINSGNFKMEYSHKLHRFTSEAKLSDGSRLKPGSPFLPINFSLGHSGDLVPGSFAQVWLNIGKTNDAIVVPKSALMEQQGVYFVFVKLGPEDYLKTPVKIASMNAYEAQIATGLHVGDEVVVSGVLELKLSQSSGAVDPHAGHNH